MKFFYAHRNKNSFFCCFFYRNCFHTLNLSICSRREVFSGLEKKRKNKFSSLIHGKKINCAVAKQLKSWYRPIVIKLVMTQIFTLFLMPSFMDCHLIKFSSNLWCHRWWFMSYFTLKNLAICKLKHILLLACLPRDIIEVSETIIINIKFFYNWNFSYFFCICCPSSSISFQIFMLLLNPEKCSFFCQ